MGEVRVPVTALWRAQTQRAVENFPISGRGLERTQIRALGLLKGACAQVNKDLGLLAPEKADAIIAAAGEIADGLHDDQFPIDVFQTGSGTSSNMNTNEVIASIAAQNGVTVHPNDDVNMSQSSNDTFPTATHIAATEAAVRHLIPALEVLHESLASKARQWRTVVKSGRTHLMDAVPVTLGQEFSGYARQVEAGIERVKATLPRLGELAIGGTAVGTGLNAPDGFGEKVVEVLVRADRARRIAHGGQLFRGAGRPRRAGRGIRRTAHDRGLADQDRQRHPVDGLGPADRSRRDSASGPAAGQLDHAGQGQPGDPRGGHAGGRAGGRQRRRDRVGWRERRVRAQRVHPDDGAQRAGVVQDPDRTSSKLFAERCVDGLVANEEHLRELAESSPSIVTPLNSAIGYEEAAAVAKEALKERKTIRQTVIDRGLIGDKLSEAELDKRLDVLAMAKVKDGDA